MTELPRNLTPPIDMSRVRNEKGVKAKIKQMLDHFGWFHWMPPANGYGSLGVHDHHAIKDGVFLTIEAKFDRNRPTPVQKAFAAHVAANNCTAFCVTEKNIDHLAWWLESFQQLVEARLRGEEPPAEHASRCINAQAALTELWA